MSEEESQLPVSREMFYNAQRVMADTIKQIAKDAQGVNHKLDEQTKLMATHFSKVDTHMEDDTKWKKLYTPYIKGLANISDGGKLIAYIIVTLGAVGAAFLAIKSWLTSK